MVSSSMTVSRCAGAVLLVLLLSITAWAGRVRTLPTNSREMPVINLMTGRSTVLRFPAAPKKVVLGNQNYFNVEFIDSDITLQPLGSATSNLFVYGDGFTYGFILKVNQGGEYDDLVFVRGKLPVYESERPPAPTKKAAPKPDLKYGITIQKGSFIQIRGSFFKWNEHLQTYFTDLALTIKGAKVIQGKSLDLQLLGEKGDVSSISPVFEADDLIPGKPMRVRLFSKLEFRTDLKVKLKINGKEEMYRILWRH